MVSMNSGNPLSQSDYKEQNQDFIGDAMKIDLMKLHVPKEDTNIRRCLRAYTILPKFCDNPNERNEKAKEIMQDVWKVRDKIKRKFGRRWGYMWLDTIPYEMSYACIKDWMIGRASIPLIAIDSFRKLGFGKEAELILEKVEYVSSTTQEIIKIPKKLNLDIFYLCGLVLGDGCLPTPTKDASGFSITSGKEEFLNNPVRSIIEENFETVCSPLRYYNHGGPTWCIEKRSKALHRFFTKIFGLPSGKKSEKAHIPKIVKKATNREKVAFLSGLIDSDIGKHGGGMGCTFRSKKIVNDLIELLSDLGINAKSYGTHYKDNKYEQNDFTILKSQIKSLKVLLSDNYLPKREDRLATINTRAGVR